jgi:hemoglobin-like flavoprotein
MPSNEAAAKLTPQVKAVIKATAPVLAGVGTEITATFYPLLFQTYPEVRTVCVGGCDTHGTRTTWHIHRKDGRRGLTDTTHQHQTPQVKQLFNKKNQQAGQPVAAARGEDDEGYSGTSTISSTPASPSRPAAAVGAQPRALANAVYAYAANIDNLGALKSAIALIAHKHASLHVSWLPTYLFSTLCGCLCVWWYAPPNPSIHQSAHPTTTQTQVLPEHYPMVGACLLKAIKTVLGGAATDEVSRAIGYIDR